MKKTICFIVLFLGRCIAGAPAFDADPPKLLGMSLRDFLNAYPSECKKVFRLRELPPHTFQGLSIPASAYDLHASFRINYGEEVYRCEIRHRAKEILRGFPAKILQERLYIKAGRIAEVQIQTNSPEVMDHFQQAFGASDTLALGFEDHSNSREVAYSEGGYSSITTLSSASESSFQKWTKCSFLVILAFHSIESFQSGLSSSGLTATFRPLEEGEIGTLDYKHGCPQGKK